MCVCNCVDVLKVVAREEDQDGSGPPREDGTVTKQMHACRSGYCCCCCMEVMKEPSSSERKEQLYMMCCVKTVSTHIMLK